MAQYNNLKTAIQQVIRTNGNNEITGALLQQSLLSMINSLGAGYQFMGVATPSTNPGTPDYNVSYLAGIPGAYSNFDGYILNENEIVVFQYNGSWSHNVVWPYSGLTIEYVYGKNLYNPEAAQAGYIDYRNGAFVPVTHQGERPFATEFIKIDERGLYVGNYNEYGSYGGYAVYDINKNFIRGYKGSSRVIEYQPGDAYVRSTINKGVRESQQINVGTSLIAPVVPYEIPKIHITSPGFEILGEQIKDGDILGIKIVDHSIGASKLDIFQTIVSKNLLNPDLFHTNNWISADGNLAFVTSEYGYFDYIAISPNTAYHVSNSNGGPISNRADNYIAFYKADKSFISSISANTTDFMTPANAAYVRLSVVVSQKTDEMLELGNERTSYEPYSPPQEKINPIYILFPQNGVDTVNIKDGAVTQSKLADNVSLPSRPVEFKGFHNENNNLAVGSSINTELVYITKNTLIVAEINGTIQSVKCGVGYNGMYEGSIEITPTQLIVKKGTGTTTYTHGLTLGNRTIATISKNNDSQATIKIINDYGAIFTQMVSWGTLVGRPFLLNNNTSGSIAAKIQFMPRDINQKIWMFGDSYFSFDSSARWPYYMLDWGYNQWLANARGGENATEGLADFQTLLGTGKRPSFAVWCMGMNAGRDTNDGPNVIWLQKTTAFLALCAQYHITPILATIPTVPTEIHTKLNEWVRASGYRYIDFAKAVENGTNYYWKGCGTDNQLLSNDEVHPSVKGAIALASQAIIDFPEISIVE